MWPEKKHDENHDSMALDCWQLIRFFFIDLPKRFFRWYHFCIFLLSSLPMCLLAKVQAPAWGCCQEKNARVSLQRLLGNQFAQVMTPETFKPIQTFLFWTWVTLLPGQTMRMHRWDPNIMTSSWHVDITRWGTRPLAASPGRKTWDAQAAHLSPLVSKNTIWMRKIEEADYKIL